MREIHIDLSSDYYLQQPKVFGGYAGEHNESKLIVKLPNRMIKDDISYYYFEFQTVLGEHITSPNVYKNTLSTNNEISIVLWEQLSLAAGNLKFCVNAIELGENSTVTIKGKTPVCTLYILETPTGKDVLIDTKSSKEELQKSIDSALKEAKDSGEFKGDDYILTEVDKKEIAGMVDVPDIDVSSVAPAIKNTVSGGGKSISVNDVSPLPHKCSCRLTSDTYETTVGKSNNIYNFAANNDGLSISVGGSYDTYTFTRNENGTITINGYLDSSQPFSPSSTIYSSNLTLGKTYALSLRDSNGEYIGIEAVWGFDADHNNLNVSYDIINNGIAFKYTDSSVNNYFVIWNRFNNSSAENPYVNYTLYPQLEMGSQVTDWTEYGGAVIVTKPYIEDFSTVIVNIGSESYTPSADGFVTDIVSASPTMEITTNNQHANIHDFIYCVDTKKYIDNNSGGSLTVDQTYNPNSENAQSGKAVAEAVTIEEKRSDNTFANALKSSKSGSAILIDDVSPVTQEMGVRVKSKNLLTYPYVETTLTRNGITFTDNGDGTITANGTATADAQFRLQDTLAYPDNYNPFVNLINQRITVTGSPDGSSKDTYGIQHINIGSVGNGNYTITNKNYYRYAILIKSGITVENLVFKPQLELGTTSTAYTPYIPDLTAVKVTRCGKNLLSAMSLHPTVTNNAVPIHFKAGQKYTISFTTTYTAWRLMFFGTDKNGTAFDASSANANKYISGTSTGDTGRLQHASNQSGNTLTFTCNEDCIITAIVFWNVANETNKTYSDFQLEMGDTATNYEPYITPVEYTPTADGTVEGVLSLYPNTTLTTDTGGIIIDCEYNRDINKAFAELQAAIISLGGNI